MSLIFIQVRMRKITHKKKYMCEKRHRKPGPVLRILCVVSTRVKILQTAKIGIFKEPFPTPRARVWRISKQARTSEMKKKKNYFCGIRHPCPVQFRRILCVVSTDEDLTDIQIGIFQKPLSIVMNHDTENASTSLMSCLQ